MKLVELKNVGNARISIRQVRGLALDPGESTKVPPATATHPAVKRYIGRGLELVGTSKEEPKAPAPPVIETPQTPTLKPEPTPDSEEETESEDTEASEEETVDETAGNDLREDYLTAPGVTDVNVGGLLEAYPNFESLADAFKNDLCDLGVSKSYAGRLKSWAKDALDS